MKKINPVQSSETLSLGLADRSKIDSKYKWKLSDIYSSIKKWEADYNWLKINLVKYSSFKGTFKKSSRKFLRCLKFDDEIGIKIGRLNLYAMLAKDIDLNDTKGQVLYERIVNLSAKLHAASSFIKPEIISLPGKTIKKYLSENKELKIYEHFLDDIIRTKNHTLTDDKEELLANVSPALQTSYDTYSFFTNADMEFPTVEDEKGQVIQVTHGRYLAAMYSEDRSYRERFYRNYYKPYKKFKNTFASLFSGNIKSAMFNASARRYKNTREAALDANNIPVGVYDNLIRSVGKNLEVLHRWCSLKKKILGFDEFHAYDIYVTLFPGLNDNYTYNEAVQIVRNSLSILGPDYINNLKHAFENRWIDVFETKGKRSGAYSSGTTFGVHPYVLLNWNSKLNDVFTLAHEMGHNMHSFYTEQNQPYPYANYSIFIAEVTSTLNEALMLDYLIENAKTRDEKLGLLEKNIMNIITTFYRQTLFATYEQLTHETMEKGNPITSDFLCSEYGKLHKKYWGKDMFLDNEETYTWSRVPHFYYNFYVYQYATSFAASEVLVEKFKKEGQLAVNKYIEFLKAGSSNYPLNVLRKAGVDMQSAEPIHAVTRKMDSLITQIENLL